MIGTERPLAVSPVRITPEQRDEFRARILPFVMAAREKFEPIRQTREALKALAAEENRVKREIEEGRVSNGR